MAEEPLDMAEELLGWDSIPFKANSKSNVAKEATKRGGQTLLAPLFSDLLQSRA